MIVEFPHIHCIAAFKFKKTLSGTFVLIYLFPSLSSTSQRASRPGC